MSASTIAFLALLAAPPAPALGPGDHARTLTVGGRERSYLVHVPKSYDPKKPVPVVLAFHGAAMTGRLMALVSGLSPTADREGFLVVYPDGTGDLVLTWNAGGLRGPLARNKADDVAFTAALLDDLARVAAIDARRVYATGLSNGAMMTYRLAAELSDRIAAIAPVAGAMPNEKFTPKRPVSVLHFHGTADTLVPYKGARGRMPRFMTLLPVEEGARAWAKLNGCPSRPTVADVPNKSGDGMKVTRTFYGPGKEGSEVVLYTCEGGGHVWPGRALPFGFLGTPIRALSANDLMWEFFRKHPRK
jgi:polyhydroxybutyrate depolymerase